VTTQPLAKPLPVLTPEPTDQRSNSFVLWGFVTLLIGAAIGVVGKKLLHQDIVTVVGVLISLVGMFLTVYPFLSPPRPRKNASRSPSRPEELTSSSPSKYLAEARTEYIPSITERTTDLLQDSPKTRSRPGLKAVNREP